MFHWVLNTSLKNILSMFWLGRLWFWIIQKLSRSKCIGVLFQDKIWLIRIAEEWGGILKNNYQEKWNIENILNLLGANK